MVPRIVIESKLPEIIRSVVLMTRQQVLDLYFVDARHKLIELGAFMDRVERAAGEADFRLQAFHTALTELSQAGTDHAQRILQSFSDPTTEPIPAAPGKGACGAWNNGTR